MLPAASRQAYHIYSVSKCLSKTEVLECLRLVERPLLQTGTEVKIAWVWTRLSDL